MSSITKPEFWLVTLGFIIIISTSLLLFGNSLRSSPEITLNNDSIAYLDSYAGRLRGSGLQDKAETELEDNKIQNPVLRFVSGVPGVTDFLGAMSFLVRVTEEFWGFVTLVFGLPTFFIATLGLDLGAWSFVVNTFSAILFLSITIMLVRLIK
jgi:hypothetical protein